MNREEKLPKLKTEKTLVGVGGFLAWAIVGMTIGTPLVNAIYVAIYALTHTVVEVLVVAVFTAVIVGYSMFVGIRLWLLKPHAVRQAKIFLVVFFALDALQIALLAANDKDLFRSLVWAVILFIYFSVSKRVKNTYGSGSLPPKSSGATLSNDLTQTAELPEKPVQRRWVWIWGTIIVAVAVLVAVDQINRSLGDTLVKSTLSQSSVKRLVPSPLKVLESTSGGFSVVAPVDFTESSQTLKSEAGPFEMHVFEGSNEEAFFEIAYNDYPKAFLTVDPQKLLAGGRDSMIASMKGRLVSDVIISLGHNPGREMAISVTAPTGENLIYHVRIFLVKLRLYQVMIGALKDGYGEEKMSSFLQSFKLTE